LHLGSAAEPTVYEAEGIGLLLGLHLLKGLSHQLTYATVLGTNNQAVIKALDNQTPMLDNTYWMPFTKWLKS
jgi:hypothetical protein